MNSLDSIAWARKDDLHGRLVDCSAEGFSESLLVSCYSFIRMAKFAEPLNRAGDPPALPGRQQ